VDEAARLQAFPLTALLCNAAIGGTAFQDAPRGAVNIADAAISAATGASTSPASAYVRPDTAAVLHTATKEVPETTLHTDKQRIQHMKTAQKRGLGLSSRNDITHCDAAGQRSTIQRTVYRQRGGRGVAEGCAARCAGDHVSSVTQGPSNWRTQHRKGVYGTRTDTSSAVMLSAQHDLQGKGLPTGSSHHWTFGDNTRTSSSK
jgi:hypothetical protein